MESNGTATACSLILIRCAVIDDWSKNAEYTIVRLYFLGGTHMAIDVSNFESSNFSLFDIVIVQRGIGGGLSK